MHLLLPLKVLPLASGPSRLPRRLEPRPRASSFPGPWQRSASCATCRSWVIRSGWYGRAATAGTISCGSKWRSPLWGNAWVCIDTLLARYQNFSHESTLWKFVGFLMQKYFEFIFVRIVTGNVCVLRKY